MTTNPEFLKELSKLSKQANHLAGFYSSIRQIIEDSKENNKVNKDITAEIVKIYHYYKLIFSKSIEPRTRLQKLYEILENEGSNQPIPSQNKTEKKQKNEHNEKKKRKQEQEEEREESESVFERREDSRKAANPYSILRRRLVNKDKNEEEFICQHCSTKFRSKNALSNHVKVHSRRMHQCSAPGCEYKTDRAYQLKRHMSIHTEVRPFKCTWPDCPSAFKNKSQLRDHEKRHSNHQHYACYHNGCSKKFNSIQNLKCHIKAVHPKEKSNSKSNDNGEESNA